MPAGIKDIMFLSSLSFTSPLLLAALAGLPVLWWLLRITPPRAKHVTFPPLAFLMALNNKEDTPHHTPLWLLILRVFIAALVIIGLSGPILNPPPELTGEGPLVLVIDDGWASASSWTSRQRILNQTIDQAGRDALAKSDTVAVFLPLQAAIDTGLFADGLGDNQPGRLTTTVGLRYGHF